MSDMKRWERPAASVLGYVLAPGESLEHPFFPTSRGLAWTSSTGGLLGMEEGALPPGVPGPYRHYHTNLAEWFYVLEGELLLQIGDETTRAPVGSFAFCPVGCVHAFRAVGNTDARVLIVASPPQIGEGYFRELAMLPPDAGEEDFGKLGQKWGMVVVGPPLEPGLENGL